MSKVLYFEHPVHIDTHNAYRKELSIEFQNKFSGFHVKKNTLYTKYDLTYRYIIIKTKLKDTCHYF